MSRSKQARARQRRRKRPSSSPDSGGQQQRSPVPVLDPGLMTLDDVRTLQGEVGNRVVADLVKGTLDPAYENEIFKVEKAKRQARASEVGRLAPDRARDRMLIEHFQGTGRAMTPRVAPQVNQLGPDAVSKEVKDVISERSTLKGKVRELSTGSSPGTLRATLGQHGALEGLNDVFGAVTPDGSYDPTAVMQAVRLAVALGKSEEAKDFLMVARDNKDEVKRLMANRPEDLTNLLQKAEFAAMTALVLQEVAAPSTRLVGGPSGAHQFDEHGAHNSAVQMILQSIHSGNPKSSWVSATVERRAVEWAENKIAAEVARLAAGGPNALTGPDSIGWKGDIAGARQVIADNRSFPSPRDRWIRNGGGGSPMSWGDFVGNSETYRSPSVFQWYERGPHGRRGPVGDTVHVGPVFNRNINVLNGTGADIGAAGTLAGRKIRATAINVPPPATPYPHPLLTDPSTTFVQGGTYLYRDGAQWKQITLVVYAQAPPITTFKAVFRKTTDPMLTYKVYTAYPA